VEKPEWIVVKPYGTELKRRKALAPEKAEKLRLRKEKKAWHRQIKEAIYKECGYARLDLNLTPKEAVAVGRALKPFRDNVAKPQMEHKN